MLTVLTWLWQQQRGRMEYTVHHVNIWAAMVRRHLAMPHRIACVTDDREGLDPSIAVITPPRDFEGVVIPSWGPQRPQCLRRLAMFRRDAGDIFGEWFVCMDLDIVISGPLDSLFPEDVAFRIYRGTAPQRPYNGSMMMLRAGARPQVYDTFTPRGAAEAGRRYLGSDQAWLAHVLGPNESVWTQADGVYWWYPGATSQAPRMVVFPGSQKPWELVGKDRWVSEHYHGERPGRCLVLGRGPTLWDDVDMALDTGPFDAVIATPDAIEHWPGKVLAMAYNDQHAEQLVHMYGFRDAVHCGKGT